VRIRTLGFLLCVMALLLAACTGEADVDDPGDIGDVAEDDVAEEPADEDNGEDVAVQTGDGLLGEIQSRGHLECGVNDAVPGFGFVTAEGEFEGFDIDFCRVVAAAVLGDADAVEYVALTAEARFTALQAGEIDVLVRNTTWTSSPVSSPMIRTWFYSGPTLMSGGLDTRPSWQI
jgi:general L-amino acid transport system substrate-binding protein